MLLDMSVLNMYFASAAMHLPAVADGPHPNGGMGLPLASSPL